MRKATDSNATVSTMSRLKRITSIRGPALCTDKLHHSHQAPTKIIRAGAAPCRPVSPQ
jgi:hypothetical protein